MPGIYIYSNLEFLNIYIYLVIYFLLTSSSPLWVTTINAQTHKK